MVLQYVEIHVTHDLISHQSIYLFWAIHTAFESLFHEEFDSIKFFRKRKIFLHSTAQEKKILHSTARIFCLNVTSRRAPV
jgi:hypothetical protein